MIGRSAGVGIMLGDHEIGAMSGQAIEHIRCLVCRGRDHIDMIGCALIGIMGVESESMVNAVAGVDVAATLRSTLSPRSGCRISRHCFPTQDVVGSYMMRAGGRVPHDGFQGWSRNPSGSYRTSIVHRYASVLTQPLCASVRAAMR